jgi:glycosyltransferase involved in cell wall biosynthesis
MKKKIKLLNIISTLNPQYGGASTATIDLSLSLINKNFSVDIVTNDPIKSNFLKSKKVRVFNLGQGFGDYNFSFNLFLWIKKNSNKYDKFIFHGLWQFNTIVARLLLKNNFYVFTHGQLDPYFATENIKKYKKIIYWYLIEKKNLESSQSILLTNKNEEKLQNSTFVNTNGIKKKIINIGIIKPNFNKNNLKKIFIKKFPNLVGKIFFLFLGRFHKKKGCDILLESFSRILDKRDINLLMVGPNNQYKEELIKLSQKLKISKNVIWSDTLLDKYKWSVIYNAKAMVLSSNGENFGVSLAESLSMGVPVLTTNKVNIHNIIKLTNSGFISSNNVKSFTNSMKNFLNINRKKNNKMKINAKKCFDKYFNLENNQEKLIQLLKN